MTALMMEAASTSETSVNFYKTTRRNIPEDSHIHVMYQLRGEKCPDIVCIFYEFYWRCNYKINMMYASLEELRYIKYML
jgi:hypothetical protein